MYSRLDGGSGGAICIDPSGHVGIAFTSARMAWAMRRGDAPVQAGIDRSGDSSSDKAVAEVVRLV